MADNWQKKEREAKKKQLKKNKEEKKLLRKENSKDGNSLDSMMARGDSAMGGVAFVLYLFATMYCRSRIDAFSSKAARASTRRERLTYCE